MEGIEKRLLPSLICSDLYNMEQSVHALAQVGYNILHVDILDGHFSPSMPLGLGALPALRARGNMRLDVHLMTTANPFFVDELLRIGCDSMCFHLETTDHADYLLNTIRQHGIRAGVALKPSTPVGMLEEILDRLDFVLLMLINPGYAGHSGEQQVPYACRKIRRCAALLEAAGKRIPIEVDGRVNYDNLPQLLEAGADDFVGGTGTTFRKGYTLEENKQMFDALTAQWRNGNGA